MTSTAVGSTPKPLCARRASAGILAQAFVLCWAAVAFAGPLYQITDLGDLAGTTGQDHFSTATAVNNKGQVAGFSITGAGGFQAFLYSNGIMTDLGTLGTGESRAAGINDAGQVVGYYVTIVPGAGVIGRPFLYTGGKMVDLIGPVSGGGKPHSGSAAAINNAGQIVGQFDGHAALYTIGGTIQDLGTLEGTTGSSAATAINSAGHAAGWSYAGVSGSDLVQRSFLYAGGKMTNLGTLGANLGGAAAINEADQVVGTYNLMDNEGSYRGFLYSDGKMIDLGVLPGLSETVPAALNDAGDIAGGSFISGDVSHPFLYHAGAMQDLNGLIPPNSGWRLLSANGINDVGQIVGSGLNPAGETHAFLLTPIPEPMPALLLSLAAGLLVRLRRPHDHSGN